MPPPPPAPKVPLFPSAPAVVPKKNDKLNDAVNAAVRNLVEAMPGKPVAKSSLSLIDMSNSGYGVFNDDQEHYAASAVKIAVMYAAYALLGMVQRYNTLRSPSSPKALFDGLRSEMNGAIEHSSNLILGGVAARYRVPDYEQLFDTGKVGSKLTVRVHRNYAGAMEDMIVLSKNERTAQCVHSLGYSYLNGALEKGGFFKSTTKKGGLARRAITRGRGRTYGFPATTTSIRLRAPRASRSRTSWPSCSGTIFFPTAATSR